MNLRGSFGLLVATLSFAAAAMACSAPPMGERSGDSANALSGTLQDARTCAIIQTYEDAPLSAFSDVSEKDRPNGVSDDGDGTLAKFSVPSVGEIFIVQTGPAMSFYNSAGRFIMEASGTSRSDGLTWQLANGQSPICTRSGVGDGGTTSYEGGIVGDGGVRPSEDGGTSTDTDGGSDFPGDEDGGSDFPGDEDGGSDFPGDQDGGVK